MLADILRPQSAQRRLRHGEERHHRRDRHVRGPADVVGLRPRQAHLLRRPPAGQQHPRHHESIKALTRDQMDATSRGATSPRTSPWWRPATSTGTAWCRWSRSTAAAGRRARLGGRGCGQAPGSGGFEVMTKPKVAQEHVLIMRRPAPRPTTRCATPPTCWRLAVGDDSGSRLYWALVDPGLAESADIASTSTRAPARSTPRSAATRKQTGENLDVVPRGAGRRAGRRHHRGGAGAGQEQVASRVVRGSERPWAGCRPSA